MELGRSRYSDFYVSNDAADLTNSVLDFLMGGDVTCMIVDLDLTMPYQRKEWAVTKFRKVSKAMRSNSMIAVDCEMVLCEDGTEAVVKVCLVDHNLETIFNHYTFAGRGNFAKLLELENPCWRRPPPTGNPQTELRFAVKLDKLVNPQRAVVDYRTEITGVSAKDLEGVTCSLVDVQKSLKRILSDGTILVGHTLYNDLQVLKLSHPRVIDTAFIFKYLDEPTDSTPSLNSLCKAVLGYGIRGDGAPHNCQDDAHAAMKLVLAKMEHGFNDPIAVEKKNIPETELRKLLIHRIPIGVLNQELAKIFPADLTVEIEPNCRVRGENYSTYAVFDDSDAAEEAFERIDGKIEKDLHGRLQKLISFQSANGLVASFFVRKMTIDSVLEKGNLSKKRFADNEVVQCKKLKVGIHQQDHIKADTHEHAKEILCHHGLEHPCKHVKEIEKLKRELQEREEELFNLQKILSALTRKHGL
ncbi:hypothetical protein ACLOJK_035527 [Asimina triloba]